MFICEGKFIKIECFKIPTRRFPFYILGGGALRNKRVKGRKNAKQPKSEMPKNYCTKVGFV